MSLINDALKRAKEAQKNQSPSPDSGPQLRPAEPAPDGKSNGVGLFLPIAILLAVGLMVLFVWRASHKNGAAKNFETPVQSSVAPVSSPNSATVAPAAASTPPEQSAPAVVATTSAPSNSAPGISAEVSASNATAVVAEPPPKPAPPKLQAIFFNPRRPSAIVNGKTVFIGDRFGEFRVATITQESVTLTNGAQKLVLTLE